MGVQSFIDGLNEFTTKVVPETASQVHRAIALEGLNRLVKKTPVDTGHARAGWQVTIGEAAQLERAGSDKSGASTISEGASVIRQAEPYTKISIANNVPYIEVLEDGRREGEAASEGELMLGQHPIYDEGALVGHEFHVKRRGATGSIQAPHGMLGVTFEELVQALEQVEDAA